MKKKTSLLYKFLYRMNLIWINVAMSIIFAILAASSFVKLGSPLALVLSIILLVAMIGLDVVLTIMRRRRVVDEAKDLGLVDDSGTVCTGLLDAMQLPTFIVSIEGKLIWANVDFKDMCDALYMRPTTVVQQVFTENIDGKLTTKNGVRNGDIAIGRRTFRYFASYVATSEEFASGGVAVCVYFYDITAVDRLKTLYRTNKVVLGEILIDNYEEIYQANGETVANQVLIALNDIFAKWIEGKNAIIKGLARERYIIVVTEESLKKLEEEQFIVLESAKKISVGNSIQVTLSIGISSNRLELTDEAFKELITDRYEEETYKKAFRDDLPDHIADVEELLNLSLSRGGDQAIVKIGSDKRDNLFFGGSELDIDREDMVEVRVRAGQLKSEILKSDKVLIMGHALADLDALGSALAMYRIAASLGKPAYVVLGGPNSQISVMYNTLMQSGEYNDVFVSESEALNVIDEGTLTIVVDTFSARQCESPEVVKKSERIVVIDHHRRGLDAIENAVINYTVTGASSASELIIELMRYIFPSEKILKKLEAETLYGGILVDTKNMFFKTGRRTFDVCAYLRQLGVVPVAVRKYIQPNYEDYKKINAIVSEMKYMIINGKGVAVTICDLPRNEANTLAPIAADKMLEIAGVDCSFVLIKQDSDTAIKARSLGEVNVQIILENQAINGGGHFTAAAGLLKNTTPDKAEQLLISILKNEGIKNTD